MPNNRSSPAALPRSAEPKPSRPTRADGIDARDRMLRAALRLFARYGYERTSTRLICDEAAVNISAIAYYFGDKAALYRAAFKEPMGESPPPSLPIDSSAPLQPMLKEFYREMLRPLSQSETIQDCMRLHFREFVDPTGLWEEEVNEEIRPQHEALVAYFAQRFGTTTDDVAVHRMVFAIVGMAIHMFVGREIIQTIEPRVIQSAQAVEETADALAEFALAIVHGEALRRNVTLSP
jgi:TetR/AcrR family transcriptional regulator, regulator of cefoperazone and chloramphenicol sensitivity